MPHNTSVVNSEMYCVDLFIFNWRYADILVSAKEVSYHFRELPQRSLDTIENLWRVLENRDSRKRFLLLHILIRIHG